MLTVAEIFFTYTRIASMSYARGVPRRFPNARQLAKVHRKAERLTVGMAQAPWEHWFI